MALCVKSMCAHMSPQYCGTGMMWVAPEYMCEHHCPTALGMIHMSTLTPVLSLQGMTAWCPGTVPWHISGVNMRARVTMPWCQGNVCV